MSTGSSDNKVESKVKIPSQFDSYSVYKMLQDFVANPEATNPLRIPVPDPFVRHFIHHAALRMDLISASEGGATNVHTDASRLKAGPVREVVIWKGRQNEIQEIRKNLLEFASNQSADKMELPPMPAELRYASRLLARDYGLVGISEGLGTQRHCILWKTQDRQQIDEKLRRFASSATPDDKLEFPPMDPSMRRFTAEVAADLGLHAISEGFGKDKHTIVYRSKPSVTLEVTAEYLRNLFKAASPDNTVPERVSAHDIRGALQQAGIPEMLGKAAIELAERAPDGHVSINTLCTLVDTKEKELRRVFNAFDREHAGRIRSDDIEKVLKALDISPTTADHEFMQVLVQRARDHGEEGITFRDFRNLCSFLDLNDLTKLGSEHMAMSSLGFQPKTTTSTQASYYSSIASALSGGIANAWSRTCVAPFERLRLQMAVDGSKYKGMMDCFMSIYRNEGVRGLWRGNVLNVIRIAPQGAIAFFTKDAIKAAMPDYLRYSSVGLALGSMASGVICMGSVYPLDFVRGRMTTCPGHYKSWQSALAQIYREGGIRALYEGVHYSNLWAAVYYGVQFYSYDTIKAAYLKYMPRFGYEPKIDAYTGLAFGAASGVFCVSAAYPWESIRRKLQVQGVGGRPVLYSGWMDCFRKTVAKEGYKGLYRGLGANMIKTPPSIAIVFASYEVLLKDVFRVDKKN